MPSCISPSSTNSSTVDTSGASDVDPLVRKAMGLLEQAEARLQAQKQRLAAARSHPAYGALQTGNQQLQQWLSQQQAMVERLQQEAQLRVSEFEKAKAAVAWQCAGFESSVGQAQTSAAAAREAVARAHARYRASSEAVAKLTRHRLESCMRIPDDSDPAVAAYHADITALQAARQAEATAAAALSKATEAKADVERRYAPRLQSLAADMAQVTAPLSVAQGELRRLHADAAALRARHSTLQQTVNSCETAVMLATVARDAMRNLAAQATAVSGRLEAGQRARVQCGDRHQRALAQQDALKPASDKAAHAAQFVAALANDPHYPAGALAEIKAAAEAAAARAQVAAAEVVASSSALAAANTAAEAAQRDYDRVARDVASVTAQLQLQATAPASAAAADSTSGK